MPSAISSLIEQTLMADANDPETLAGDMEKFQIVDVRYPNEWEAGDIDSALHIPHDDVFDRVGELDRNRPVVTLCRSGSRRSAPPRSTTPG